jgi:hypothetical protein
MVPDLVEAGDLWQDARRAGFQKGDPKMGKKDALRGRARVDGRSPQPAVPPDVLWSISPQRNPVVATVGSGRRRRRGYGLGARIPLRRLASVFEIHVLGAAAARSARPSIGSSRGSKVGPAWACGLRRPLAIR